MARAKDFVDGRISGFILLVFFLALCLGSGLQLSMAHAGLNQWSNVGPAGTTVLALAVDPLNTSTLYAGTEGAGLFKSTDGGSTWNAKNSGLIYPYVLSLAFDPKNQGILYAGTISGVFKSTDGGESWNAKNDGLPLDSYNSPAEVTALAVDPVSPRNVYAGTTGPGGIFKSTDAGETWNSTAGLFAANIHHLVVDPINPNVLYAGNWAYTSADYFVGGLHRSTDSGATWVSQSTGLGSSDITTLAINPLTPSIVYAASNWMGLYKTLDGGQNWFGAGHGLPANPVMALAIDPAKPDTLYAGVQYSGVYKTTDGGLNWTPMNNGLTNLNVAALGIDPVSPNILYAGTAGPEYMTAGDGVFKIQQVEVIFAVNCGGLQYVAKDGVVYQTDNLFSGGQTYKTPTAIAGTEDDPLFQSERYGVFSYNIPVPNGIYSVTLKFAEIYPYAYPGARVFDVKVEGKEVITNVDIAAKVGLNKAYEVIVPATVTDGVLNIAFSADAGSAKVNAILVTSYQALPQFTITATAGEGGSISPQGTVKADYGTNQKFTITPSTGYRIADVKVDDNSMGAVSTYTFSNVTVNHKIEASFAVDKTVFAVNCGGPQYTSKTGIRYQADTRYSGGQTYTTTAAIGGTEDGPLYQTERFQTAFSYNIPVVNGSYLVTLKFSEIYPYIGAGQRVFSVKIEGREVISKLDLFARFGLNKAYDATFPLTVTDGVLNIDFKANVGSAKVNAILVSWP